MYRFALLLALSVPLAAADFNRDVQPVLARCQPCHSAAQAMSGLRLDSGAALLAGGMSGSVIAPGKAEDSLLMQRVTSDKKGFMMPPAGPRLTPDQIATIKTWIDEGAKISGETKPIVAAARKSSHWSFQRVQRPAVPAIADKDWTRNPIDRFIAARLDKESIKPSPEAPKRILLRRLYLDLTGLPPSPAEVEAFLSDARPDAYERTVDQLLASPHYGEKWARSWLDAVHYADSDGYEKDLVRPWAWRYRNWVIDALNKDMPFDKFTVAQIAGDLLPGANIDDRVATGFQRTVLTNREAGVDRAEARFEQMVSRTNTIGSVWLGLTVGCAQCHNHKYDPIPQRDYYRLMGFSWNVIESDIPAPMPGELGAWMQSRPAYQLRRQELLNQYGIAALQSDWENQIRAGIAKPGEDVEWDFAVTEFKGRMDNAARWIAVPADQRTKEEAERMTDFFIFYGVNPGIAKDKAKRSAVAECRQRLKDLQDLQPNLTQAMTIVEDNKPADNYVAIGGDYKNKGEALQPGTLTVLPGLKAEGRASRLDLARWLISAENPLTARVTVNRMWQDFFGRGLVRTSEDFGTQGEKPSHPELLDWLASEFMDRGWSMKQMHRLIVTSAAYRQSSATRKDVQERDPENVLVARQGRLRLPAELIRDGALEASGLLNDNIGGPSIRPPQPAGIAELGYANSVKWVETKGPERYRRGLYIHFQRTAPYPMLMTFDEPDSNVACTRRARSNTPLQALNLLNDPVFLEAAQGLAARTLLEAGAKPGERIDHMFELTLARKAADRERERLAQLLDKQQSILRTDEPAAKTLLPLSPENAAWVGVARIVLNLDEFITRE